MFFKVVVEGFGKDFLIRLVEFDAQQAEFFVGLPAYISGDRFLVHTAGG